MKKIFIITALAVIMFVPYLYADQAVLQLKNEKSVAGEIVEETDDYIKLKVSDSTITYYKDDIEAVERLLAHEEIVFDQEELKKLEAIRDGNSEIMMPPTMGPESAAEMEAFLAARALEVEEYNKEHSAQFNNELTTMMNEFIDMLTNLKTGEVPSNEKIDEYIESIGAIQSLVTSYEEDLRTPEDVEYRVAPDLGEEEQALEEYLEE